MNKKPLLTFILGTCLGAGGVWTLTHHGELSQGGTVALDRACLKRPDSQATNSANFGKDSATDENAAVMNDSTERASESEPPPGGGATQMERFERGIAAEDDPSGPAEETSAVAPEEAPPEVVPEEPDDRSEDETK